MRNGRLYLWSKSSLHQSEVPTQISQSVMECFSFTEQRTTLPFKGKLTVTNKSQNLTRDSILNPWKFQESSLQSSSATRELTLSSFKSRKMMSLLLYWAVEKYIWNSKALLCVVEEKASCILSTSSCLAKNAQLTVLWRKDRLVINSYENYYVMLWFIFSFGAKFLKLVQFFIFFCHVFITTILNNGK